MATVSTHKRRFGLSAMQRSEAKWGYAMIAPVMIGFSIFFLFALVWSLYLSFTRWNILESPVWIGFQNYRNILQDDEFRQAMIYTFAIAIPNVILRLICALAIAMALNTNIRFRAFYRVLFFLPVLTMPVAIATIWKWMFDPLYGPVNAALRSVGGPQPEWLSHPRTAIAAIVVVLLWSGLGYDMIIFLAGLQAIPKDFYDASAIDGATPWQQFRDITLPLLTPTTFFLMVIAIIGSLQVFDLVFVMTRLNDIVGLPTIVYYIYDEGFRNQRMGYAISVAWVLLLLILVFTLIQFRLQRRWVHYA